MSDKSPVKTPTRRSSGNPRPRLWKCWFQTHTTFVRVCAVVTGGTGVGRFSPGHEQSTSPQAGVAPELGDDLARSPTHRGDTRATQYSDTGLVCVMKGHKNKNWPIRSAFFQGANFSRYHKKEVAAGGVGHRRGADSGERAPFDDDEEQAVAAESDTRLKGAHDSLLLATGSADNLVYLFDVGETMARALRPNTEATKRRGDVVGTAPLLQQLHGHTDRVYAVHFHPTEPVLATGSADFTIKMWAPRRKAPSLTQPR
jgi:WD40 repeat protein